MRPLPVPGDSRLRLAGVGAIGHGRREICYRERQEEASPVWLLPFIPLFSHATDLCMYSLPSCLLDLKIECKCED